MRKIIAVALLCGFSMLPGSTEANDKDKGSPKSHSGSSFTHTAHGRHYRFERCNVRGRDCFRFWWEARRCFVYWYPGATSYFILTDAGLVPLTAAVLPGTVPMTGPVVPVDGGLPPLPTGTPGTPPAPMGGAAPMIAMPR